MKFKPVVSFESELPIATEAHRMTAHLDGKYSHYTKALNLDNHDVIIKKTPINKEVIVVPGSMSCLVQIFTRDENGGMWPVTPIDLSAIMPEWKYPSAGFVTAPPQQGDPNDGRVRVASSDMTKASSLSITSDAKHVQGEPWVAVLPTGGVPGNQRWWDSRPATKKKRLDWWVSYPFVPQRGTQWYISDGQFFKTAYGAPRGLRLPTRPLTMAYQDTRDTLVVAEAPSVASFVPQAFVEYSGLPLFIPVLESLTFKRYTYTAAQPEAHPPQPARWTLASTATPIDLTTLEVSDRQGIDCKRFTDESDPWYGYFTNRPALATPLVVSDDGTRAMALLRFGTYWGGAYPTKAGDAERVYYSPEDSYLTQAGLSLRSFTNKSYSFLGVQYETNPTKFLMDYYVNKQYTAVRVDYAILRVNTDGSAATLKISRDTFGIGASSGQLSRTYHHTRVFFVPGSDQRAGSPFQYFDWENERQAFARMIDSAQAAAMAGGGRIHTAETYRHNSGYEYSTYDGDGKWCDESELDSMTGFPSDFHTPNHPLFPHLGTTFVEEGALTPERITANVDGEGASVMMCDFHNNEEVWLFTRYKYNVVFDGVSRGNTNLFESGSISTNLVIKDGQSTYTLASGSTGGSSRREYTPLVADLKAGVVVFVEGIYTYDGGFKFTPSAVKVARRSNGWVAVPLPLLTHSVGMYIPAPQVPQLVARITEWSDRIYRHFTLLVDWYITDVDTPPYSRSWSRCYMRDQIRYEIDLRYTTDQAEHHQRVIDEAPQVISHWEPKDYNDEPITFPQLGSVSMDGNRVVITASRGLLKDPLVELKWSTKDRGYKVVHHLSDGGYDTPDGNLREARFGAGNIQNVHFSQDGPLLPWPEPLT